MDAEVLDSRQEVHERCGKSKPHPGHRDPIDWDTRHPGLKNFDRVCAGVQAWAGESEMTPDVRPQIDQRYSFHPDHEVSTFEHVATITDVGIDGEVTIRVDVSPSVLGSQTVSLPLTEALALIQRGYWRLLAI